MSLIAVTILALLAGQSLAHPFGGFGGLGGFGGNGIGDYGGYGFGGYGGYDVGGIGEYGGVTYPGAARYARGDFVRGSPYGGVEYGTRREAVYRPPYSRFYNTYYPSRGYF